MSTPQPKGTEPGRPAPISRRTVLVGSAIVAATTTLPRRRPRAAQPPLRIGVILPLSGYLAQPGQACHRAAVLAPGLLADLGHPVTITTADTESSAEVARSRAEQLINDGVQVLIGAFESGQTTAIAQVCEQRGVPLIINIASAPQITEQGFRTVFRNFPTSPTLIRNGLELMATLFAVTGHSPKRAVFLHANDTFGMANKTAFDQLFPTVDLPFTLADTIAYDPKAQDLAIEVGRAKATKADLVIVTTRANDAILIIREMVRQRFEPMGLISPGSPGFYDDQFYRVLGRYGDFCITNLPWIDPTRPLAREMRDRFVRQWPGDRYDGYSFNIGFTLEAILIAADAYHRAGSGQPEALLGALRTTVLADRVMIGTPITFDPKGQNPHLDSATIQNLDQRPTVVLPAAVAERTPVFPMPGWRHRS